MIHSYAQELAEGVDRQEEILQVVDVEEETAVAVVQ